MDEFLTQFLENLDRLFLTALAIWLAYRALHGDRKVRQA